MGNEYTERDKDSFWELDLLLPKKIKKPKMEPFASEIKTVEVQGGEEAATAPSKEALRLTMPMDMAETQEYAPSSNRLLLRVRITRRHSEYNFYGQFRRDAEKYLGVEGTPCPFTPFFSYIPQYAQLTVEQRNYYFYWRTCMRRGEYLKTEESYFYLYVYEIINLPGFILPKDGIRMLCQVWKAYRDCFPRIDKYMAEWISDYCLVHELPCPQEALGSFLPQILSFASLREFYLGSMGDFTPRGIEVALAFFSDYSWQKSRYAAEHYALFESHITAAVTPVLKHLFSNSKMFHESACSRKTHDAFCGSLCAHHIKCRIEVEYYALNDISSVRAAVTAAVKYAENKLRAVLLIKSRLSVSSLDEFSRNRIDAYFAKISDQIAPAAVKEHPDYEKLYDAPTKGVDFARAARIEEQSWDTTKILVAEETDNPSQFEEMTLKFKADENLIDQNIPPMQENGFLLEEVEVHYLFCLLKNDRASVRHLLSEISAMEEEIAEHINEKAVETLGDIVLAIAEEGYHIIEDYTEEVAQWIR